MSSRKLIASMLTTCFLAVGLTGIGPVANAAPAGPPLLSLGESTRNKLVEVEYRDRDRRIYLPIGPSYLYYDYPYYYSRGYYPRNIGPGYAYYGNTNAYERDDEDSADEGAPYSSKERCARRFQSFDWDTGLYTTYGGHTKLCPYLR